MTPAYPVVQYNHVKNTGDAITSGFVYQGKIAALRGKYIFGDITTGRIWYVNYDDMLAADDGDPGTMAAMHEVQIVWDKQQYSTEWRRSLRSPTMTAEVRSRGCPGRR